MAKEVNEKVANNGTAVTPPTNEDIYVDAAKDVTDWTSVVVPEDDATTHLEYKDDPTVRPEKSSNGGVTPPTNEDIYVKAAKTVDSWPEIALDDSTVQADDAQAKDDALK